MTDRGQHGPPSSPETLLLLGEIRGDVKHLLRTQELTAAHAKELKERVESLERSRSWLTGLYAGIGVLAGAVLQYLFKTGAGS